eukprot:622889_1
MFNGPTPLSHSLQPILDRETYTHRHDRRNVLIRYVAIGTFIVCVFIWEILHEISRLLKNINNKHSKLAYFTKQTRLQRSSLEECRKALVMHHDTEGLIKAEKLLMIEKILNDSNISINADQQVDLEPVVRVKEKQSGDGSAAADGL